MKSRNGLHTASARLRNAYWMQEVPRGVRGVPKAQVARMQGRIKIEVYDPR